MGQIKFNIGDDTVTGKKQKYESSNILITNGSPRAFDGSIHLFEVNGDPAIPVDGTRRAKELVASYGDVFQISDQWIDVSTKLYAQPGALNATTLMDYLSNKAINTFPGVAGGDPAWKLFEGLCKELMNIRKLNGEFV